MNPYTRSLVASVGQFQLVSNRRDSRWSHAICSQSSLLDLCCDALGQTTLRGGDEAHDRWNSPLDALKWLGRISETLPRNECWLGYLSYDMGRWFETLPSRARDEVSLPLFRFVRGGGSRKVDRPEKLPLRRPTPPPHLRSTFTRSDYLAVVGRAIDYIAAGDIFQVNLSQRLTLPTELSASRIFRRLSRDNPAPFGALLDFGDYALISNSPELFFRVEPLPDGRRRIVNRPIKGTRPFLTGMNHELEASEKDKAELAMIVDLQRNDLGRICEVGSVKVTEPRVIEAHSTVYHGVSTIEGILWPDVGFVDILRAMFPCGSVTGCPKIRAMEIIEELEPVRRGPYCGAIGWIGANGAMEFSVAIRTIVLKDGLAHIPVGGGIVADSDPAAEYEETLVKARAMLAALGVNSLPRYSG